jgi:hypothetical protein
MTWADFYLVCFLVGFGAERAGAAGRQAHLHLPHLHMPPRPRAACRTAHRRGRGREACRGSISAPWRRFWPGSAARVTCWSITTRLVRGGAGVATLSGLGGAAVVFWFLAKVLMARSAARSGRLRHGRRAGQAEHLPSARAAPARWFFRRRARAVAGARSEDGAAIPKGAEVVVTRYEKGIAYVRRGKTRGGEDAAQRRSKANEGGEELYEPESTVFVAAGSAGDLFILIADVAKLYRKAGPHEALIVYGFGGTRVIKGRGTVIFPMVENLPRAVAGADVVRRRAETGPLHPAGRRGHGGSRGADQGEVGSGVDPHRRRAVSDQAAGGARRPDPAGDGRPPARHHRPADGGRDREAAGNGGRPHALHLRRRHEQDGPGSDFVHHQGSPRQERVHHQHGPAGRGAHQARRRRGRRRSRARHGHQARRSVARSRRRQSAGRPGAGAGRDAFAGQAGRGAARPGSEEGRIPGDW